MKLGCYKLFEDVNLPSFGTEQAACFDIYSYLPIGTNIVAYSSKNEKINLTCSSETVNGEEQRFVSLPEGWRILIPTALIFDIPKNYSVRIHARSGIAWKQGLVLANSEGIIDSDYVDPTFIMLQNTTIDNQKIYHKERIAQGELVKSLDYSIDLCYTEPSKRSSRSGGFGSTGVK